MAKPFDVTLKHLLDKYPQDWLGLLGIDNPGPIKAIDADLATISAAADKVFRLSDRILHLEVQASYKTLLPDRLHLGNTVLYLRHKLPVLSVAVLLRPEADGRAMNGVLRRRHPTGSQYLEFHYDVVRIWQLPVDSILTGGSGILPLAPLVDESQTQLPTIIKRMKKRLENDIPADEHASIWAATYVLMGLRYSGVLAGEMLRGVRAMKESVTYQAIVEEGEVRAAREFLLDLAVRKFGKPDRKTAKLIAAINEYDRLRRLHDLVQDVDDWRELLQD